MPEPDLPAHSPMRARRKPAPAILERAFALFLWLRRVIPASNHLLRKDAPALRRSRLSWVRQNYIREETLTHANACLVAAQNGIDLARRWGGGDVASADGLRFVVPVRTIHAGPNPKYFGPERGVTYYNLVSDQFTGLNAITVPGTLRDSLVLLSIVLEQETELEPTEIMTIPAHTPT
jgi:TnpA family transposase